VDLLLIACPTVSLVINIEVKGFAPIGLPCPPWCDSESKMLMQSKPGPPWRDRSWTMPRREKPGLGQGLGQGRYVLKLIYQVHDAGLGQGIME
jgi:hypothetical protein